MIAEQLPPSELRLRGRTRTYSSSLVHNSIVSPFRPYPLDIYALPVLYSTVSIPHCHIESEVMAVIEEGRITVHEAAAVLGLSVRQVRRLAKTRLNGKLEVQDVVQPAQEVLTVDRRAVLVLKAEREGLSANEGV